MCGECERTNIQHGDFDHDQGEGECECHGGFELEQQERLGEGQHFPPTAILFEAKEEDGDQLNLRDVAESRADAGLKFLMPTENMQDLAAESASDRKLTPRPWKIVRAGGGTTLSAKRNEKQKRIKVTVTRGGRPDGLTLGGGYAKVHDAVGPLGRAGVYSGDVLRSIKTKAKYIPVTKETKWIDSNDKLRSYLATITGGYEMIFSVGAHQLKSGSILPPGSNYHRLFTEGVVVQHGDNVDM